MKICRTFARQWQRLIHLKIDKFIIMNDANTLQRVQNVAIPFIVTLIEKGEKLSLFPYKVFVKLIREELLKLFISESSRTKIGEPSMGGNTRPESPL